ncbi:MFS transporter [uncultured Alistipes sp.]|uniref:MFS transporter n=1 Tax=uncultured Alistipes sp. TaxID=538949 RepID=UPI002615EC17|nr:MFS transporter [uncultured Alistipes sp.]
MKNETGSIRRLVSNTMSRIHPFVLLVSCMGILLAYLTGMYVTGTLHAPSRWMGAMLACTSVVVVLQSPGYKESLRPGLMRVLGTFLGALIAYLYLSLLPFSVVGMLVSVFVLEMICMWLNIYNNGRIATITLLIILLVSQMNSHVDPAMNCMLRFFESVAGVGVGIGLLWVIERWNRFRQRLLRMGENKDGKPVEMDTMPLRWGHFKVLIVASLGQVTGAGLATLVGIVLPMIQLVRHPGLSSLAQGAVAATSLVGIMVGSVVFGAWSDRRGYLLFFRLCPAIILAASLFAFFSDNLPSLVVALFLMGMGIGGGYSLDSDYISEIMPRRWRLLMVGVAKASSSVGNVLVALVCVYLLDLWRDAVHWNGLLLLISALAVIMLLCRVRFAQSPGWLLAHGRTAEAQRAVRYFLGSDVVTGELNARSAQKETPKVSWSGLFRRDNLSKVIFSGVPWACEGLGVYGIGVFMPVLIMSLGLGSAAEGPLGHIASSVRLSAYINLFVLAGFVLGLFLVNRWYHVRTQTWGFLLCAAGMGLLLAGHEFHWPVWVSLAGFMVFELFLNAGPHLMTFIIPPQIYPVSERGAGAGLAAAFGKLGAVIGVLFIPMLLKWGGMTAVLSVTIAVQLVGAAVTAFVGRRVLPDAGPEHKPEWRHDR